MLNYRMAPVNLAQALRPATAKEEIPKAGFIPIALGTALGAATAWVGFRTGARERGFLSALGYIIGASGALSAFVGTTTLVMLGVVSASPPEPIPEQKPEPAPGSWVNSGYA